MDIPEKTQKISPADRPRILALDVLRGITIAGMITVNNPGSWNYVYAPLKHAAWNGLTPTDLVFPFFMFIMGVSMYVSYRKFDFRLSGQTFVKLFRRSLLLFLIGLFLNWFGLFCRTLGALRPEDLSLGEKLLEAAVYRCGNLRIPGVLQRLALVSFFGALILLWVKPRRVLWIAGAVLVFYTALMVGTGSLELTEGNIAARVDVALLGASHMYRIDGLPFDPEGFVSTVPCIAHVLLGVWAGQLLDTEKGHAVRIQRLFIFGTICLFAGFLLDYLFPINKTLWSSSYVLVTCGLASLMFALLIWIIDMQGRRRWCVFFESFGVNPMAIFVMAGIFSNLLGNFGFARGDRYVTLKGFIYGDLLEPLFGPYFGSLVFALLFIVLCWSIGHILYRRKIYIKL